MTTLPDLPSSITPALADRIAHDRAVGWVNPYRTDDARALRREDREQDRPSVIRPPFVRDVEKVLHLPAYNRYNGKTQVFSFRSNDDLSRRGLHVQLVSRIARDIGAALGLNCDLIEAIGLSHDLGHTPFGHAGERILDRILRERTGRRFLHNVHSVRVMDALYGRNMCLQTLDGALAHNGEYEQRTFELSGLTTFAELDALVEGCARDGELAIGHLRPATLEGCVVRISDIIAYVGRDRQDAIEAGLLPADAFDDGLGGGYNSWILSRASVDIIEHSYGRDRIEMGEGLFSELARAKRENYEKIYRAGGVEGSYGDELEQAFRLIYERCRADLEYGREDGFIFRHHIRRIERQLSFYGRAYGWRADLDQTVVDYIASMTDEYFTELACTLFPNLDFPRRTYINER